MNVWLYTLVRFITINTGYNVTMEDANDRYITIKDAAKMLGVTPLTLRNWDRGGKFPASRHPINNYRVYRQSKIENFIRSIGDIRAPVESSPEPNPTPKKVVKKLDVTHLRDWEQGP